MYSSSNRLGDGKHHDVIACNKGAKENIIEGIPQLINTDLSEKTIFLIVPQYKNYEKDLSTFKELANSKLDGTFGYFFCYDYDINNIKVVTYNDSARIIALDDIDSGAGRICKDPIIILNNFDTKDLALSDLRAVYNNEGEMTSGLLSGRLSKYLMFKTSNVDIESFAQKNGFDLKNDYYTEINVYEKYLITLDRMEKLGAIAGLLLAVMLFLETVLIVIVVRMEYSVNAKLIAIKKIFRYNMFQKNKKIFILTLLSFIFGFTISICINLIFKISSSAFIISGCALLAVIETIILIYYIVKIDKARIVKILKGGNL